MASCRAQPPVPQPYIDSDKLAMTVMAVDDNPANLKLIGALLDDLVQHVILCDSGQDRRAGQTVAVGSHSDGYSNAGYGRHSRLLELIRHLPHQQQTPVIAVTAHALEGQREKLLAAGMNDYLAKPIEEDKLSTLLLRYQPGMHVAAPQLAEPVEPVIDHNVTLNWQAGAASGCHETRPRAGDAANAARLYAGGAQ